MNNVMKLRVYGEQSRNERMAPVIISGTYFCNKHHLKHSLHTFPIID